MHETIPAKPPKTPEEQYIMLEYRRNFIKRFKKVYLEQYGITNQFKAYGKRNEDRANT